MTLSARLARRSVARLWPALLLLALAPARCFAQTDSHLLLDDWAAGNHFESSSGTSIFPRASIGDGETSRFQRAASTGRLRFDSTMQLSPSVGYDWTHIGLSTGTRLPSELDDLSFAVGSPLFKQGDWFGGAQVGFGYAGDAAFSADDAWYGKGDAFVGIDLHDGKSLIFQLTYNGNRTLYPDVPLPSAEFDWKVDPTLEFAVGFPVNAISWKPTPKWTLSAEYDFPLTVVASARYQIIDWLAVVTSYKADDDAFHSNLYGEDRRIIYNAQRVELGLTATPAKGCELNASVGYGFERSFQVGFDERTTDTVADLASQGYVRFGFDLNF